MKVRLHATLRRPTPDGYQNRLTVKLDEQATVGSLLAAIKLDQDADHLMILIGRRRVDLEHPLEPDDQVDLFPPISGGWDSLSLGRRTISDVGHHPICPGNDEPQSR